MVKLFRRGLGARSPRKLDGYNFHAASPAGRSGHIRTRPHNGDETKATKTKCTQTIQRGEILTSGADSTQYLGHHSDINLAPVPKKGELDLNKRSLRMAEEFKNERGRGGPLASVRSGPPVNVAARSR